MSQQEHISRIPIKSPQPSRSSSLNRMSKNNDVIIELERMNLSSNRASKQFVITTDPLEEPQNVNLNIYQQKKSLAQGMLDLALLSANANQLRYILESLHTHPYGYFSLVFIIFSIVFQIVVGLGLVLNSRYNVNNKNEAYQANLNNNIITIGILMITIINVIVPSFSVAERI